MSAGTRRSTSASALCRLAATAAAVGLWALAPATSHAAEAGGHLVAVLPDSSGLELSAYPIDADLTVDVLRAGVTMATATVTTDGTGAASINGGTQDCWTGVTPDILPGDSVEVSGAGVTDSAVVADVRAAPPVQTGPGTIVVHGSAADANGAPPPVSALEARIVAKTAFSNGRKTLRAAAGKDGFISYDSPTGTAWTATFQGLTASDVASALRPIETRGIYIDPAGVGESISQSPAARGPMAPCSAPLRSNGVTGSDRAAINLANRDSDVVLQGVAFDATSVTVRLDDSNPVTPAVTAPATLSAASGPEKLHREAAGRGRAAPGRRHPDGLGGLRGRRRVDRGDDAVAAQGHRRPRRADRHPGRGDVRDRPVGLARGPRSVRGHPLHDEWHHPRRPVAALHRADPRHRHADHPRGRGRRRGQRSPSASWDFVIAPLMPRPAPAPAPATRAPAAAPAPPPLAAVVHPVTLRLVSLSVPARVRGAQARRHGVRITVVAPAGARVVRIEIRRGSRHGRKVASTVRTLQAGRQRIVLRGRAVRRLTPGRYVVTAAPGRSARALGITSAAPLQHPALTLRLQDFCAAAMHSERRRG